MVVVSRSISRVAGKDFHESIVRCLDDCAVFLFGVRRVDLQSWYCGLYTMNASSVCAVHGRVGEKCQFHVIAELLAAVGIERQVFANFLYSASDAPKTVVVISSIQIRKANLCLFRII